MNGTEHAGYQHQASILGVHLLPLEPKITHTINVVHTAILLIIIYKRK